jgi:pyridoxamine 5'-phosphate oxidase
MPPRLASLAEIDTAIWRELSAAAADREHEWREVVLATTDGEVGDARTVVLREVEPEAHLLRIYTDERSGKVLQLRRHPQGTLLAWSRQRRWQLRCRVSLSLLTSGLAVSSRWARVRLSPGARDYLSPLPPGTPVAQAPSANAPDRPLGSPLRDSPVERSAFAVIEVQVLSWDWLELHPQGHRRARFDPAGGRWLQP